MKRHLQFVFLSVATLPGDVCFGDGKNVNSQAAGFLSKAFLEH